LHRISSIYRNAVSTIKIFFKNKQDILKFWRIEKKYRAKKGFFDVFFFSSGIQAIEFIKCSNYRICILISRKDIKYG